MRLAVDGAEVFAYTGTRPFDAARAVVMVHGAANDHSVFALQSRYLAHHGFGVLALDLPGHGRSRGKPIDSAEAIGEWIARVLDAAHCERAAMVGHSLGSLAVLEAAARHPKRASRIALLGPAFPMSVSDALLAAARENEQRAFEMINQWSHSAPRQLGGNPAPGQWMTGMALALMERTPHGVLATDLEACNRYARGIEAAQAVECPALAVIGERDLMAPPKNARALAGALRDVHVVTLAGCGHAMMTEQPDAVLDALRAFLSR